ncbi:hypothetical protein DL98DRAFT_592966 [Cadophora sp. DSE1049]|nr:hypothetical protein DL98DRAFT_592966 [Cadophora sp. DSE1049]
MQATRESRVEGSKHYELCAEMRQGVLVARSTSTYGGTYEAKRTLLGPKMVYINFDVDVFVFQVEFVSLLSSWLIGGKYNFDRTILQHVQRLHLVIEPEAEHNFLSEAILTNVGSEAYTSSFYCTGWISVIKPQGLEANNWTMDGNTRSGRTQAVE